MSIQDLVGVTIINIIIQTEYSDIHLHKLIRLDTQWLQIKSNLLQTQNWLQRQQQKVYKQLQHTQQWLKMSQINNKSDIIIIYNSMVQQE